MKVSVTFMTLLVITLRAPTATQHQEEKSQGTFGNFLNALAKAFDV